MNGLESLPQHGALTANGLNHVATVNNVSHVRRLLRSSLSFSILYQLTKLINGVLRMAH